MTRKAAQLITIRQHQDAAPVNVHEIAKALGLDVYSDRTMPDAVSGLLTKDEDGYYIVVNAKHHPNRQRFTVAHEIAHFILHKDQVGDGVQDSVLYRSHLSGKLEWEANRLAADILMPMHLIEELEAKVGYPSVEYLARSLKVSKSAMSIRLGVPLEDE